jgi:hypothetical protein
MPRKAAIQLEEARERRRMYIKQYSDARRDLRVLRKIHDTHQLKREIVCVSISIRPRFNKLSTEL